MANESNEMLDYYTDGATEGVNGRLGTVKYCGVGVICPDKGVALSKRIKAISNNEAEFYALIEGMQLALNNNHKRVRFNLDSLIVVNRALGRKPKKKKYQNARMDALQAKALSLARQFDKVEFRWIPRDENWLADELSRECLCFYDETKEAESQMYWMQREMMNYE